MKLIHRFSMQRSDEFFAAISFYNQHETSVQGSIKKGKKANRSCRLRKVKTKALVIIRCDGETAGVLLSSFFLFLLILSHASA